MGAPPVQRESVDTRAMGEEISETEVTEFGHRARGETVAAGLVARERRSIKQHHVATGGRGIRCGRGTARTCADDEDVGALGNRVPGIERWGVVATHPTSMSGRHND